VSELTEAIAARRQQMEESRDHQLQLQAARKARAEKAKNPRPLNEVQSAIESLRAKFNGPV
jgi:hypothetical protein